MGKTLIHTRVITPAGKCPIVLEGSDDVSIMKWVQALRSLGGNSFYTREALQYWVKDFYDPSFDIETWRHVRSRVEELIDPLDAKKLATKKKKRRK